MCLWHAAYIAGVPEDAHDEASWLLTFYSTFQSLAFKGIAEEALQSLAKIEGQFGEACYPGLDCSASAKLGTRQ